MIIDIEDNEDGCISSEWIQLAEERRTYEGNATLFAA